MSLTDLSYNQLSQRPVTRAPKRVARGGPANSSFQKGSQSANVVVTAGNLKYLNICHLNCQSPPAHHGDLLTLLDTSSYHFIGIAEPWLSSFLYDNFVKIPSNNICRNYRVGIRGGGIVQYVNGGTEC